MYLIKVFFPLQTFSWLQKKWPFPKSLTADVFNKLTMTMRLWLTMVCAERQNIFYHELAGMPRYNRSSKYIWRIFWNNMIERGIVWDNFVASDALGGKV